MIIQQPYSALPDSEGNLIPYTTGSNVILTDEPGGDELGMGEFRPILPVIPTGLQGSPGDEFLVTGEHPFDATMNDAKISTVTPIVNNVIPTVYPSLHPEAIMDVPTRYIDLDEQAMMTDSEKTLSEDNGNVILVPVSISENPVMYNQVVTVHQANPDIPIAEVTDAVKKLTTPEEVGIVNVPLLQQHFPGVSGEIILQNIQNNVPLSEEATQTIIQNQIITSPSPIQEVVQPKKKVSVLDKLTNYFFNLIYTKNG
jgi:hypothetical protein